MRGVLVILALFGAPEIPERSGSEALSELALEADVLEARLKALEDKVDVLRDGVVSGSIHPTRIEVVHQNDLGSSFLLRSATYRLDGQVLLTQTAKNSAALDLASIRVFEGVVDPGKHVLEVELTVLGSGEGLLSYLRGERFDLKSKHRFVVAEGLTTRIDVILTEKKDISLSPAERLVIRHAQSSAKPDTD